MDPNLCLGNLGLLCPYLYLEILGQFYTGIGSMDSLVLFPYKVCRIL
jgi:hypothetical protein